MPQFRFLFYVLFLLFGSWLLIGCQQTEKSRSQSNTIEKTTVGSWAPPAPGTVVAEWEERVEEDKLNETYFRVSVISTDNSLAGVYDLSLGYGFNINETSIELPSWPEQRVLQPVVSKGQEKYQCLIGFDPGDGTIRPFYEVRVENKNIRLKQTHQYYFD